jgi:ADP-ribose pyrophosphatase YjhB (NUDIX family)
LLYPGCWACPGGKAETGETPEENVIREVKEETNLNFKPTELLLTSYQEGRKMFRFLGTWSGEIILQEEEVVDYGWFTFDEALRLDLAFDYRNVIAVLNNRGLIQ